MATVPPAGGQQPFTERPTQVYGEQYRSGSPPPAGAVPAFEPIYPAAGGPYVSTPTGVYAVHDTDWVVSSVQTGQPLEVIADAVFQDRFTAGGGAGGAS